jgi:hypothetical protein
MPIKTVIAQPSAQNTKEFRNLNADDAKEFISFLKDMFGEPDDRVWPRAEKMGDIVLRRRTMLNALDTLERKGFTNRRSGGGFLVPDWEIGAFT